MLFGPDFTREVLKGLLQILGLMFGAFIIGFLLGAWLF